MASAQEKMVGGSIKAVLYREDGSYGVSDFQINSKRKPPDNSDHLFKITDDKGNLLTVKTIKGSLDFNSLTPAFRAIVLNALKNEKGIRRPKPRAPKTGSASMIL